MRGHVRPQLGSLIVTPFVTIGVLASVLVWEIEHVGSVTLAIAIAASAIVVGVVVARRLRRDMDELADHYEAVNRVKDEFLDSLSHELRTPLNSVLGWSRLLASGKLDATQTTRAIQAIERAGHAQARLVDDLLDLSRIVSGKLQLTMRPTMVQPLVQAAVDSLQPAAEAKRITIEVTLDPAIGATTADPDRLQQIVWNLVSNAIKFTPSGGHVDVRLEHDRGNGDDAASMCLSVRDNGVGFRPESSPLLFEQLRQVDSSSTRRYGGLGIGLGIVRQLAELHGGTVHATSAGENMGSLFEVRIPIRPAEVASVPVEPPKAEAPTLRGVSVLIVDDDPRSLEFARSTLEQHGAIVVAVSSAREARERFARDPTDVLISDLAMPDEDGLQLIRAIRDLDEERGRRTPAAALTALARSEDRRRALDAGFQMHVAKPIDPSELVAAIERLAHEPPGIPFANR